MSGITKEQDIIRASEARERNAKSKCAICGEKIVGKLGGLPRTVLLVRAAIMKPQANKESGKDPKTLQGSIFENRCQDTLNMSTVESGSWLDLLCCFLEL